MKHFSRALSWAQTSYFWRVKEQRQLTNFFLEEKKTEALTRCAFSFEVMFHSFWFWHFCPRLQFREVATTQCRKIEKLFFSDGVSRKRPVAVEWKQIKKTLISAFQIIVMSSEYCVLHSMILGRELPKSKTVLFPSRKMCLKKPQKEFVARATE